MKIILLLFLGYFHPFYVSVTEINHNSKTKALEISTKIFFDDLERGIEKERQVKLDIAKPSDKFKADDLVAAYLKRHLKILVNGTSKKLNYLGYEIQGDAVWCHLEIPNVAKMKEITVINDVLYDLHKEQIHIINVIVDKKRQSTKLDAPSSKAVFKIK